MLSLVNPLVSADDTTPDESFIGWIWNKITGLWDYWFKGEVIESLKEIPNQNKLGTATVLSGWQITKQEGNEQNFDVYVSNKLDKETDICLVVKEGVDTRTVDLSAKPISNQLGAVTDKSVPLTLSYEPSKCLVNGEYQEGYKLQLSDPKLSTIDSYVKIGTNSLVLEYQNESKIQYDFDWGQANITLLKNNTVNSNIYVFYNITEGKIDFGANDYSSNLKDYVYLINTTGRLVGINLPVEEKLYPYFYNYNYLGNFQEYRQAYSFKGICDKYYSNCSWNISNDGKSAKIGFKSYGDIETKSITNVSACATLDIENEIYNLNQSITGEDCIMIDAKNITLNGKGYMINGTLIGGSTFGIAINNISANILNFSNIFKNTAGIYILNQNNTINNVTITGNTYGILLLGSITRQVSYNNINNSIVNSNRIGINTGDFSSNNQFNNISMWNCSLVSNGCIYINRASGNVFNNIYINYTIGGYGIRFVHDSYTSLTSNNIIKNSKIENIGGDYDVYAFANYGRGNNNTLLNVSYNDSKALVLGNEGAGNQVEIIRQWWYSAYVNDSLGNNLSNVNVTIYDKTNTRRFNVNTNSNGLTTPTPIIDYTWTLDYPIPIVKTYYSLYNNTAVKGLPNPSYAIQRQIWNVTIKQNTRQDFTLNRTPTSPIIYSPSNTGYSGMININYTPSFTLDGKVISFYNISLLDSSFNYLLTIKTNNSLNLSYIWDSSSVINGNYIINVTACDNISQCNYGYSNIFTISNFKQDELYILPEEKTFYTNENADVIIRCRYSNGSDCPIQTHCRITSYYPNRTLLSNNQFMTNNAPLYNYNFGTLTTTGAYNSIVFCYNNLNGTANFNFDVLERPITSGGYGKYGYNNPKLPHLA